MNKPRQAMMYKYSIESVLNEVRNGDYCVMPLTLDYLCRKYEGMSLAKYLRKKYKDAKYKFWLARDENL